MCVRGLACSQEMLDVLSWGHMIICVSLSVCVRVFCDTTFFLLLPLIQINKAFRHTDDEFLLRVA